MASKIPTQFINNLLQTAVFLDAAFDYFYKPYNITRVQYLTLIYVLEEGADGIALSKLGEKMSVSRANITKLIDRMEKSDFVKRIPDTKDRRSIKVKVSDNGMRLYNDIMPQRMKFAEDILAPLTQAELDRGNKVFEKVYTELHHYMKLLNDSETMLNRGE